VSFPSSLSISIRQPLRRVVGFGIPRDEAVLRDPAWSYEKSYGSFILRAMTRYNLGLIEGGGNGRRRRWRRRQGGAS
jgi:hypothetical protein